MLHIVTDSTADIPPPMVAEWNITVVPCFIMFGTTSFLDGVTITREQFYARLMETGHAQLPTTAAPGAGVFEQVYRRVARPGDDILSIHVASTLSGMCNSARLGGEAVPEVRVTVYDSSTITMGLGYQVVAAARAARQGQSLSEILTMLDKMKKRTFIFAALDTLEFLRRSGRVSWAGAMLGQILDIKPILQVHLGKVEPAGRVRTRTTMLTRLSEMVAGLGRLEALAVLHTTAPDDAIRLAQSLSGLVAGQSIPVMEVTPTIGVHVGPNGVGIAALVE